jgi:hypothetical protein
MTAHIHTHSLTHVYIYMCLCVCVCERESAVIHSVSLHIYGTNTCGDTEGMIAHTQTHRHTDTQTHRHTHTCIYMVPIPAGTQRARLLEASRPVHHLR